MDSGYYSDYSDIHYELSDTAGLSGIIMGMGMVTWLITLAVSVLLLISMWKVFTKAGKPGWAALIPIYNVYIMCEIAEKPWWYMLLFLVPFANIYAMFVIYDGLSKKLGKTTGFTVGLMLLPVVFFPILAFSKSDVVYNASSNTQKVDENAVKLDDTPYDNTNNNESTFIYDAPSFNEMPNNAGFANQGGVQMDSFDGVNSQVNPINTNEAPSFNEMPNNAGFANQGGVQMNSFNGVNNQVNPISMNEASNFNEASNNTGFANQGGVQMNGFGGVNNQVNPISMNETPSFNEMPNNTGFANQGGVSMNSFNGVNNQANPISMNETPSFNEVPNNTGFVNQNGIQMNNFNGVNNQVNPVNTNEVPSFNGVQNNTGIPNQNDINQNNG